MNASLPRAQCSTFWRAPQSRVPLSHNSTTSQTNLSRPRQALSISYTIHTGRELCSRSGDAHISSQLSTLSARRMASTASTEAPEWSAQRVRDTFLQFFEDRDHTFGIYNSSIYLRPSLTQCFSQIFTCGTHLGPNPPLHQCGHEPVQTNLPWYRGPLLKRRPISTCSQLPEMYSCWRQAQRPRRCGQRLISSHLLRDVG